MVDTDIKFKYNGVDNKINPALANILQRGIKRVKKDDDLVILIFGQEGAGKSEIRNLIGAYCQSLTGIKFSIDNIWFTIEDYMRFALSKKPLTVISHDEARRDLNTKRSMSKSNVKFTNYFSECRDNNQIHIIILPAFSDIDKYIALWRAKILIEVSKWKNKRTGDYERGKFKVIKNSKRKKLDFYHKNKYSKFSRTMTLFSGKFTKCYGFPYDEYKKKKQENKLAKYTEEEKLDKSIVLTQRQIEVVGKISPYQLFKDNPKDQEILRKLVYSLRKVGKGETSL